LSTPSQHLAIIGGGSAAFAGAHRALDLGARVTMCNRGLPIGGTCLNVGCVPSKTLIRAAEAYHRGRHTGFRGLRLQAELEDFPAIIEEKRELVRGLRTSNYEDRIPDLLHFKLVPELGRLRDAHTVETDSEVITADHVLIATGTSPLQPDVPGLSDVDYLTNESAFELDALPESMVVLGGGYIALECAQMFSRFGTRITVLQRSAHILSHQPRYLGDGLMECLAAEGLDVVCNVKLLRVTQNGDRVTVETTVDGEPRLYEADRVLVATGRGPNTEHMGLEEAGVERDEKGYVRVADTLETTVPGVYAAGDVIGDPEFVYTASYEAEIAVTNALTGTRQERDYTALPWVIFTDPQVAGVGWDEDEAMSHGYDADHAVLPADRWPRLKVARDMRGFLKLIRDRRSDRLLGARVLAPEGGDLITELGLAVKHGLTVTEIANTFHPYLTLSEGIQRAAQRFTS
jgi:mercuric reductase